MDSKFRACAEIDLDALGHNIDAIRSRVGEDTRIMAVIKTNAYGHGAVECARYLSGIGVHDFAVATIEEGLELRRSGIEGSILVLGFIPEEMYPRMIEEDITATIYSDSMARHINAAARLAGKNAKAHIKLDTGMGRIGFRPCEENYEKIVIMYSMFKHIDFEGIYTHFACADCADDEMTAAQFREFMDAIETLEEHGAVFKVKHCANSAAVIRYPEMRLDMVRAGIILYGLYPSDEINEELVDLKPVMSLKSRVIMMKNVEAGEPIGYGSTFVCSHASRIATVSIGYGDGYPRALSNRGRVIIRGQSFPIVGRVCMDQLMVDTTSALPEAEIKPGDEVILVGAQGSEKITAEEASSYGDSFNYEFVCNINRRIPRVYIEGGEAVSVTDYLD
ncbi:MAG: alanine racemase [Lachnospiraceae bacterium]|nr:alanine racemase [Lachnospiraceae bacterium]